jgi:Zn-dependent protease with chaperone function
VVGVIGLLIYLLHLAIAWALAHPVYRRIYRSESSRWSFVRGQLLFSTAILIPWVLVSSAADLLQYVNPGGFLSTDTGEFITTASFMVVFLLFAPGIIVRVWGCKPLPEDAVRAELEEFCRRNGFKVANFLLWPLLGGEMLTAAVVGILPAFRYILITRGLLNLLDTEELKAVTAHEIGHVRRLHLLFYLFLFFAFTALVYRYGELPTLLLLDHEPFISWATTAGGAGGSLYALVALIPFVALMLLFFRFIFGFFLRNSERQADLYGMKLVGHPFTLVSSLRKIALFSGQIEDQPNWHHYSIRERVDFLLEAHENPDAGRRHNRKLYGAAILYTVLTVALLASSPLLEKSPLVERLRAQHRADLLKPQLERHPGHALLQGLYGGLLIDAGRYGEAQQALLRALELAPEDPSNLNNLAWLYATAPPPYFNPEAALRYAEQAAALKPEPTILDTLAEAYHVNGQDQRAVETIDRAIALDPENPRYFSDQRSKFMKALEKAGG